jgi:hypothetical protein
MRERAQVTAPRPAAVAPVAGLRAVRPAPVGGGHAGRATPCACGGNCPRCIAQPKLKVSHPDDPLEREADRVAERVLSGTPGPAPATAAGPPPLQRVSAETSPERDDGDTAPEEEQQEIQRLASAGNAAPPADAAAALRASDGAGEPIPPALRGAMEAGIGAEFSAVRVHADARAASLCESVSARAFTHGANVYFNRGEYRPDAREGRRVLAHELVHVVQQGAAGAAPSVQRMAALDHTGPDNIARVGRQPWGAPEPTGNDYYVETDAGSRVMAWVAYSGHPQNLRYWCHGFSLGTYDNWGYSVYSGADMKTAINDEYRAVTAASAQAGDLAVWTAFQHSARFTSVSVSGGALDESASRLDSKNGQRALANYSLAQLVGVPDYGPGYQVYRRR